MARSEPAARWRRSRSCREAASISRRTSGRRVQISAVMVDPDHKDADVTIEEKTTTDPDDVRLIRFRGHLPKGGYDVQTDGRHFQAPAAPAIR
jgi:hypothetical protein